MLNSSCLFFFNANGFQGLLALWFKCLLSRKGMLRRCLAKRCICSGDFSYFIFTFHLSSIIIIIIVVVVVVVTFTITIAIIMSYPTGLLVYSYRLTSFSLCRYYVIIVSLLYHCHVMPCSYHYCILYHILSSCLPRGGNEEQVTHRAKASGCVPGLAATALRWQNFTNHLQHFLGRHGKTMLRRRGNATQSDSQLQIP